MRSALAIAVALTLILVPSPASAADVRLQQRDSYSSTVRLADGARAYVYIEHEHYAHVGVDQRPNSFWACVDFVTARTRAAPYGYGRAYDFSNCEYVEPKSYAFDLEMNAMRVQLEVPHPYDYLGHGPASLNLWVSGQGRARHASPRATYRYYPPSSAASGHVAGVEQKSRRAARTRGSIDVAGFGTYKILKHRRHDALFRRYATAWGWAPVPR